MAVVRDRQVSLSNTQVYSAYLVLAGVLASGLVWLYAHYFGQIDGEFGAQTNPLERWCLGIHGAFSVAASVLLGSLIGRHIAPGIVQRCHLKSGLSLATAFAVLIVSGYALYYVGVERLRTFLSALHWIVGLSLGVLFAVHLRQNRWRGR